MPGAIKSFKGQTYVSTFKSSVFVTFVAFLLNLPFFVSSVHLWSVVEALGNKVEVR